MYNSIIMLFLFFNCVYTFKPIIKHKIIKMSSSDTPPELWNLLSKNLKSGARDWFIKRAEKSGIDWSGLVSENNKDMNRLKELYIENNDNTLVYPKYYVQPFHGYDTGNLNWDAALEGEAATLSMAVNYWKEANPIKTQDRLRYNITNNIKKYIKTSSPELHVKNIIDVGCSVGISTEFLYKTFRTSKNVVGIDLSPFFIAMAKLRSEKFDFPIEYYHLNAENMNKVEQNSQDLIICNFIMHELPEEPTKNIIDEIYKKLKPGGVIAIIDLTPKSLTDNFFISSFRKWAFEVTEPHIYGYYKRDLNELLKSNFYYVDSVKNDPLNTIWMGVKLEETGSEYDYYDIDNYNKNKIEEEEEDDEKKYNETLLRYSQLELV